MWSRCCLSPQKRKGTLLLVKSPSRTCSHEMETLPLSLFLQGYPFQGYPYPRLVENRYPVVVVYLSLAACALLSSTFQLIRRGHLIRSLDLLTKNNELSCSGSLALFHSLTLPLQLSLSFAVSVSRSTSNTLPPWLGKIM